MAETMPTFMPGDYITYVVFLAYPGNIRGVDAKFRKENGEGSVWLYTESSEERGWSSAKWEARLVSEPKIEGTRTHVMILSKEIYKSQEPGTYRLEELEVTTYGEKKLTIDSPPRARFRVHQEPALLGDVLPSTAVLPLTGFHLPEGHPDRPQEE